MSTFRKGGAKHYNNNLEKMFDKYNYKYTNIYNLEKYFAPLLKSGFFKRWIYI